MGFFNKAGLLFLLASAVLGAQAPHEDPPVSAPATVLAPPLPPPPAPRPPAPPERLGDPELQKLRDAYQGPWILGWDLFDGAAWFRPESAASVSDDYRLGPGDELVLYVFGSATFETPLTVDLAGSLTVPRVGSVPVGGLRLADARHLLQRLVAANYSRARIELQFHKTRSVRIFILGEVFRPGSYLVPSLSSLLNALAGSGGPNAYGSFRAIQLIRDGRALQTVDLYALRLRGQGMEGVLLRDGDTLFVPVAGPRVRMEGAFQRVAMAPARPQPGVLVELAPGETAWDALQHIGGLQPGACPDLVTRRRVDAAGTLGVENLAVTPEALGIPLGAGDVLTALDQGRRDGGLVEVAGHARVPGTFQFRPGMRVWDLLRDPDQLLPDTYLGRGQILRTRPGGATELLSFDLAGARARDPAQDLPLAARDRVELFANDSLRLPLTVSVLGPFTRAGTYPWHEGMRASDLLFAAGVPRPSADRCYGELAHTLPGGRTSEVVKLDLARLLYSENGRPAALGDPGVDPALRPLDQITLYELPGYRPHRTVTLQGQVARPGPYVLDEPGLSLRQLVARAGGLTREAMPRGGIFLRNALRARDIPEGAEAPGGPAAAGSTTEGINQILNRLAETTRGRTGTLQTPPLLHGLAAGSLNRLVVDFPAALGGDPRRDVELLDGDQIIIPRQTDSAYVVGEVASPFANFRVNTGDKVRDIVRLAGGFTRNADTSNLRLLKADGRILDGRVQGMPVEPGDAILAPQRIRVETTWQENLQALTPLALILNAIRR